MLLLRNNLLFMGAEQQRRVAGNPPGARAAPLLKTRTGSPIPEVTFDPCTFATIETASLIHGIKILPKNILNKNMHLNTI